MEPIINTIPGYTTHEYLLVLSPHEELGHKIGLIKEDFADRFRSEHSRYGKPHLTLVNFVQYGLMEERIVNRLRTVAMGFPPFKVELRNFGSFPSHTIYINVVSKLPVQQLVKTIRTETQRLMKLNDDHKPYFSLEPHLSIGRKLKPWQYEKAWLEYSGKSFSGRFIADSMTLLKRKAGDTRYHVLRQFDFQNLPVSTKQGDLFQ